MTNKEIECKFGIDMALMFDVMIPGVWNLHPNHQIQNEHSGL